MDDFAVASRTNFSHSNHPWFLPSRGLGLIMPDEMKLNDSCFLFALSKLDIVCGVANRACEIVMPSVSHSSCAMPAVKARREHYFALIQLCIEHSCASVLFRTIMTCILGSFSMLVGIGLMSNMSSLFSHLNNHLNKKVQMNHATSYPSMKACSSADMLSLSSRSSLTSDE